MSKRCERSLRIVHNEVFIVALGNPEVCSGQDVMSNLEVLLTVQSELNNAPVSRNGRNSIICLEIKNRPFI